MIGGGRIFRCLIPEKDDIQINAGMISQKRLIVIIPANAQSRWDNVLPIVNRAEADQSDCRSSLRQKCAISDIRGIRNKLMPEDACLVSWRFMRYHLL